MIAGAGPGKIVEYVDGNRLNLRASNLRLKAGPAKRTDATILANAAPLRACLACGHRLAPSARAFA